MKIFQTIGHNKMKDMCTILNMQKITTQYWHEVLSNLIFQPTTQTIILDEILSPPTTSPTLLLRTPTSSQWCHLCEWWLNKTWESCCVTANNYLQNEQLNTYSSNFELISMYQCWGKFFPHWFNKFLNKSSCTPYNLRTSFVIVWWKWMLNLHSKCLVKAWNLSPFTNRNGSSSIMIKWAKWVIHPFGSYFTTPSTYFPYYPIRHLLKSYVQSRFDSFQIKNVLSDSSCTILLNGFLAGLCHVVDGDIYKQHYNNYTLLKSNYEHHSLTW